MLGKEAMKPGGVESMKGGQKMIIDKIEFQSSPFTYSLVFTSRITLVRGDSATGKTYLYQMLEDVRQFWIRKTEVRDCISGSW